MTEETLMKLLNEIENLFGWQFPGERTDEINTYLRKLAVNAYHTGYHDAQVSDIKLLTFDDEIQKRSQGRKDNG